ncbi:MAG: hypothetical protein JW772_04230 [Candidatus Diapherotrites archaeon]|nr:hypothetical protein [Candidatus Diapherotrites archaeon]
MTNNLVKVIAPIILVAVVLITSGFATGFIALPNAPVSPVDPNNPGEITTFIETGNEIELQDGKPVIRLYSTTWCPHCQWSGGTFEKVVREYVAAGKIVAYHWELDIQDNTLTPEAEAGIPQSEIDVFMNINPRNTVPTFAFGGKYYRIGNGYESAQSLALEEQEFRAVIETLLEEAK